VVLDSHDHVASILNRLPRYTRELERSNALQANERPVTLDVPGGEDDPPKVVRNMQADTECSRWTHEKGRAMLEPCLPSPPSFTARKRL
jgi:hypothetical protein